ncbi:MAG: GAF domain-containing protein, partial [Deltaproteobacteria bacterium]
KCREITNADAGSLYVVETNREGERILRFQVSQNDSVAVNYTQATIPIDPRSIAGYVACTGESLSIPDVYDLPESAPFTINRDFDTSTGYRSRSMLAVPMTNREGEVVGIVQLINCKRRAQAKLTSAEIVAREVIPFGEMEKQLAHFLAGQAAIALENHRLLQSIEDLFEGVVTASVTAIESRDPSTSGHSERVATMTVALAERIGAIERGRFRDIHFTPMQLKELRYAAILHDFGKVAVREDVLLKARKLHPAQFRLLEQRFAYARRTLEARCLEEQLAVLLERGEAGRAALPEIERRYAVRIARLVEDFSIVVAANEPRILPQEASRRLWEIAATRIEEPDGTTFPLLTPEELSILSIPRGSLDEAERREIESHVRHTRRFLERIPWPNGLERVPEIAAMHHEKLDGSGYPNRLRGSQIPIEVRMMTITDIYDALTASDRPYKKAVPPDRALDILSDSARKGELDAEVLDVFITDRIYRSIETKQRGR